MADDNKFAFRSSTHDALTKAGWKAGKTNATKAGVTTNYKHPERPDEKVLARHESDYSAINHFVGKTVADRKFSQHGIVDDKSPPERVIDQLKLRKD